MRPASTVAFHTLGCKLNFAESSTLARQFEEAGYARIAVEGRPDIFVLNTCSVTENADKECRRHVRRFRALNPEAFIVVIGCYAQLKPQEIAAIPGVDLVLGAGEKFDVVAHVERRAFLAAPAEAGRSVGEVVATPIKDVKRFVPSWSTGERTRTFLKVQDGCDYFCSFCTIPLARGRSRSANVADTVAHARAIAAQGIREVVLTGVNIGDFGRAHDETFLDLVHALDDVDGIDRFRISSIEPNLLSDDIIAFVAESRRFAPHFHIPLQSGSDAILKRMRRRYDTDLYAGRVAHIKQRMPHACIGVDVITGTPGETEAEFQRTHAFLRSLAVDHLHVFTYSERANTTAVRMEDAVPVEVRRERTQQLRILSGKLHRAFQERHLGTVRPVLFEAEEAEGRMLGFTDNYLRVSLPYDAALVGRVTPVALERIDGEGHITGSIGPAGQEEDAQDLFTLAGIERAADRPIG
ncbi:MAG: tRNA (N(6)-L-threonylcarbamoyladenosine(37)-C(2))-methylthiotransferase MtaB [Bacteroidetes bacterium]|nr:tRNA (N(6)-L-threonylcarbamoyladenosine(37)-C(2))-methylthiotransferase MtaB [Bacteroidota bacterium]